MINEIFGKYGSLKVLTLLTDSAVFCQIGVERQQGVYWGKWQDGTISALPPHSSVCVVLFVPWLQSTSTDL